MVQLLAVAGAFGCISPILWVTIFHPFDHLLSHEVPYLTSEPFLSALEEREMWMKAPEKARKRTQSSMNYDSALYSVVSTSLKTCVLYQLFL